MATMKRTYQVIMTKVYEVKVEAESREQAEEIFDNFGDWEGWTSTCAYSVLKIWDYLRRTKDV